LPEGQFHLAHATLYCALAPKSNSALGYFDALKAVEEEQAEVPDHLKDANRDNAAFGHGEGYRYPHAYQDHWVAQRYLPASLAGRIFYFPGNLGFEATKRAEVLRRREAQLALQREDTEATEAQRLVWSKEGEARLRWRVRSESAATERLLAIRSSIFNAIALTPTDSIIVLDPRAGFYAMEALRRAREGKVFIVVGTEAAKLELENLAKAEDLMLKPEISLYQDPFIDYASALPSQILLCEASRLPLEISLRAIKEGYKQKIASNTTIPRIFAFDIDAKASSMLSHALSTISGLSSDEQRLCTQYQAFEMEIGHGPSYSTHNLAQDSNFYESIDEWLGIIESSLPTVSKITSKNLVTSYMRPIDVQELEQWFDTTTDYGEKLALRFSKNEIESLKLLAQRFNRQPYWPVSLFLIEFS